MSTTELFDGVLYNVNIPAWYWVASHYWYPCQGPAKPRPKPRRQVSQLAALAAALGIGIR